MLHLENFPSNFQLKILERKEPTLPIYNLPNTPPREFLSCLNIRGRGVYTVFTVHALAGHQSIAKKNPARRPFFKILLEHFELEHQLVKTSFMLRYQKAD